jgi:hypothetical protein
MVALMRSQRDLPSEKRSYLKKKGEEKMKRRKTSKANGKIQWFILDIIRISWIRVLF